MEELQKAQRWKVSIRANFTQLMQDTQQSDWLPAILKFEGRRWEHPIQAKIRLRGRFRRMNCDFPPIKIKIPKAQLASLGLQPQFNDFKLVTHCLFSPFMGNTLVLREYMAYKLYQALTPKSFRVQLLRITYIDTGNGDKKTKRYGFLIEDKDELAARLHSTKVDTPFGIDLEQIDPQQLHLMVLFQLLIGNYDWDLNMGRNIAFFYSEACGCYVPVPYDFDFSDLVHAPYRNPPHGTTDAILSQLKLQDIYKSQMASYLLAKREKLLALVAAQRYLPESEKEFLMDFLQHSINQLEKNFIFPKIRKQKAVEIVE